MFRSVAFKVYQVGWSGKSIKGERERKFSLTILILERMKSQKFMEDWTMAKRVCASVRMLSRVGLRDKLSNLDSLSGCSQLYQFVRVF